MLGGWQVLSLSLKGGHQASSMTPQPDEDEADSEGNFNDRGDPVIVLERCEIEDCIK